MIEFSRQNCHFFKVLSFFEFLALKIVFEQVWQRCEVYDNFSKDCCPNSVNTSNLDKLRIILCFATWILRFRQYKCKKKGSTWGDRLGWVISRSLTNKTEKLFNLKKKVVTTSMMTLLFKNVFKWQWPQSQRWRIFIRFEIKMLHFFFFLFSF